MVRNTSREAYITIRDNGLLSERKWEVYDILFHHGPLTAHEVVAVARQKHPLSNQTSFNARLSELKKLGCATEVGEKLNPVSKVSNYLWDLTSNLPTKFDKAEREKCNVCDGKGYLETQQARLF